MGASVRIGVGGWTYPPWRGAFYPDGLPHRQELAFMSRKLTSIEINGTYYSTFRPNSWRSWRDETPDDFIFAVKASRYCTNRKRLADAGPSIERFFSQGMAELGTKLGPINWQFMPAKKFDAEDFGAFLALLPKEVGGLPLRHAVDVRHRSFVNEDFVRLARTHQVAIVHTESEAFPEFDDATAGFTYARLLTTQSEAEHGLEPRALSACARKIRAWAKQGDVFAYFIAGAKERNPAAARTLLAKLKTRR